MSQARAASLAATRSFVTPASADTTTIGFFSRRSATMSIAFATRCASPTDVPPNLMTIMTRWPLAVGRWPWPLLLGERRTANGELSQQPLRFQQLRIQNRRTRGAANRVVHQRDHPQIEQRTRTEAADRDAHAVFAIAIEARLRAIISIDIMQRLPRRRWQPQVLRLSTKIVDRFAHLLNIHEIAIAKAKRDRHQMAVDRRNAIHLCRDAERCVDELILFEPAEDFARLRFDLALFAAADVRNHIVDDGVRSHPVVAGSGNRLHGRDVNRLDAVQPLDRRDRERQPDDGAIRIRDDVAPAAAALLLPLDGADVV